MNSSEPREYLTLPSGEEGNFAEIYGKRLVKMLKLVIFSLQIYKGTICVFYEEDYNIKGHGAKQLQFSSGCNI